VTEDVVSDLHKASVPKYARQAGLVLTLMRLSGVTSESGSHHLRVPLATISKQLAEPNRDGRRDGLALAQNVIEMLPRSREIWALVFPVTGIT